MKPDSQPAGKASRGAHNEHPVNPFRGDNPIEDDLNQVAGIGAKARGAEGAILSQGAGEYIYPGEATDGDGRVSNTPT